MGVCVSGGSFHGVAFEGIKKLVCFKCFTVLDIRPLEVFCDFGNGPNLICSTGPAPHTPAGKLHCTYTL